MPSKFERTYKSKVTTEHFDARQIIDAVWSCVDYDSEGHAWLDNLKAEIKLDKLFKAGRRAEPAPTAEQLAQRFHEAYERLAPQFGYETRKASAKPWAEVPEQNRKLMIAVCSELLEAALSATAKEPKPWTDDSTPMFLGPPYWQCPNDEKHPLKYSRGKLETTFMCKQCDVPAIFVRAPKQASATAKEPK